MNYKEAIEYIHGTYKFGSKLGLENISVLLDLMGNPQNDLNIIHVAGTNGKGSTSSFINEILITEGYEVGLFTSPYLEVFNERIRLNNENISNSDLAKIVTFVKEKVDVLVSNGFSHPTEFEIVTAVAFEYYKMKKVDYVVLEVGLGGRLDSTNIITNTLVSVITPIDLDHTEYLGESISEVAYEKAGIIKENSVCVIHGQEEEVLDVISSKCRENNTRLIIAPTDDVEVIQIDETGTTFTIDELKYKISMIGKHQARNAAVALTAIYALREKYNVEVSEESIFKGLLSNVWQGRFEIMHNNPTIVIDGAHNLHGAKGLARTIVDVFDGRKIYAVVGILEDKDVDGILDEIIPLVDYALVTEPNNPRKMEKEKLSNMISKYDVETETTESIEEAVEKVLKLANETDVVLFFGSLYMIGEVRTILRRNF
jgi:dihydrofolate synthase/folylpolyglutamate synthase